MWRAYNSLQVTGTFSYTQECRKDFKLLAQVCLVDKDVISLYGNL